MFKCLMDCHRQILDPLSPVDCPFPEEDVDTKSISFCRRQPAKQWDRKGTCCTSVEDPGQQGALGPLRLTSCILADFIERTNGTKLMSFASDSALMQIARSDLGVRPFFRSASLVCKY